MTYHRVPSESPQANPISANTYLQPVLHQLHGQNPHVVGDDQQGRHWEGVPQVQPMVNAVMQGETQYLRPNDLPNYNAAHYHPAPQPAYQYPLEVPYVHMHRDVGVAEAAPGHAHPFAPEVPDNHDGIYSYGAHLPAADPPEAFPAIQPHAAPPADMPPANGLRPRDIAGRFINNPDTHVNML